MLIILYIDRLVSAKCKSKIAQKKHQSAMDHFRDGSVRNCPVLDVLLLFCCQIKGFNSYCHSLDEE